MCKRILMVIGVLTILLAIAIAVTGCTTAPIYKSEPQVASADNSFYYASITPVIPDVLGEGWEAFQLIIENKTDKDLELDWNRTFYIRNGQTTGGFMFEGVKYIDRANPKPPDIIFAKSTFSKVIWPNVLVRFGKRWQNWGMTSGEHGILLSVKVNGEEVREKLLIRIYTVSK